MNLDKIKLQKSKVSIIFFQSKPTINRTQIHNTLTQNETQNETEHICIKIDAKPKI